MMHACVIINIGEVRELAYRDIIARQVHMERKKKILILAAAILSMVAAAAGLLVFYEKNQMNHIIARQYEVHGVDVSHYQGTIDWQKLAGQGLDFAMIKATEGSGHVDERFFENWQAAGQTDLYVGAYHFFSFDSKGDQQAAFFISTVGEMNGKLAPVIDVEYYGDKRSNPPLRADVVENLSAMLEALEQQYHVKPIIYTTFTVYNEYIRGEFQDYPLWVRSVRCPPTLLFGDQWHFWQYMDTAVLEGYEGDEEHIDMNVFKGTRQDLEQLTIQQTTVQDQQEK